MENRETRRLSLSERNGKSRMKRIVMCICLIPLLATACSQSLQSTMVGTTRIAPEILSSATPLMAGPNSPTATMIAEEQPVANDTVTPLSTQAADCASSDANMLGAAIARDYDFTSTEQVMSWFCDGAEFEDILVALETAEQTGALAEEMLIMLAAGLTWEEIWKEVGLTE